MLFFYSYVFFASSTVVECVVFPSFVSLFIVLPVVSNLERLQHLTRLAGVSFSLQQLDCLQIVLGISLSHQRHSRGRFTLGNCRSLTPLYPKIPFICNCYVRSLCSQPCLPSCSFPRSVHVFKWLGGGSSPPSPHYSFRSERQLQLTR